MTRKSAEQYHHEIRVLQQQMENARESGEAQWADYYARCIDRQTRLMHMAEWNGDIILPPAPVRSPDRVDPLAKRWEGNLSRGSGAGRRSQPGPS